MTRPGHAGADFHAAELDLHAGRDHRRLGGAVHRGRRGLRHGSRLRAARRRGRRGDVPDAPAALREALTDAAATHRARAAP
ncbi:hypothetical protein QJS66_01450 [Kocuria rhizophila]|nr:hypothetical protein QJS66_01450 [Kocuria rhizophila]